MAQGYARQAGRIAVTAILALWLAASGTAAHAQRAPRGADCTRPTAALVKGEAVALPPDAPASLAMELDEIERIEIDVAETAAAAPGESAAVPEICDPAGVPIAGDLVPGPAGLVTLHFTAPAAGRYVLAIPAAPAARTVTLRTPAAPASEAVPMVIGQTVFARLAPREIRVWSFTGKAGQWIHVAATSEAGAALRLVGPSGEERPPFAAEAETSEGRTPQIRRKLPADGVYLAQVQSLGEGPEDLTLEVREVTAAPPPAPVTALAPGTLKGTLPAEAEALIYDIAVRAGRSYQVSASAPFDLALDLGLADPLEPAGGLPATGISVLRTIDTPRSGAEVASFTAASDGHVLLRVRGLGVYDGGEDFTLTMTESGDQVPSNSAVRTAPSSR